MTSARREPRLPYDRAKRLQLRDLRRADKRVLAERLKAAREALGLTERSFGASIGSTQQQVSTWEHPTDPAAPTALHLRRARAAGFAAWVRVSLDFVLEVRPAASTESSAERDARLITEVLDVPRVLAVNRTGPRDRAAIERELLEEREAHAVLAADIEQLELELEEQGGNEGP